MLPSSGSPKYYDSICYTAQGLTVDGFKNQTGVTDQQLDTIISENDILGLAASFDNYEHYLVKLGLSPAQRVRVSNIGSWKGNQSAMAEALTLWQQRNPYAATYRALLKIVLELKKGDLAMRLYFYNILPQ